MLPKYLPPGGGSNQKVTRGELDYGWGLLFSKNTIPLGGGLREPTLHAEKVMAGGQAYRRLRYSPLVLLFSPQDKFDEAEALFRSSLAIDEEIYGPDHPDVATVLGNLTVVLMAQVRTVRMFLETWRPHMFTSYYVIVINRAGLLSINSFAYTSSPHSCRNVRHMPVDSRATSVVCGVYGRSGKTGPGAPRQYPQGSISGYGC